MVQSTSRRAGRATVIIATAACAWATGSLAGADTPEDRYQIDRTCEALATSGIGIPNRDPSDMKALADLFAKRLQASGPAAGRSADEVHRDLNGARAGIQARLTDPDPRRAHAEQADAAAMEQKCAALPVFETLDNMKHL